MRKSFKSSSLLSFALVMMCGSLSACGGGKQLYEKGFVEGKFNISIAAQAEDGEQVILEALKAAYEEKHPEVNIVIRDFAGQTYNNIMETYSMNHDQLPMIQWMDDRDFAAFAKGGFYEDLRPFYEQDLAATDYSLYYETMLDSAAYNGEYRPTTSYTGTTARTKSDAHEHGIYFAPRDYNEIAVIYNKTYFEQYHITQPDLETWGWESFLDTLHEIGEKIFTYNKDRSATNMRAIYLHNSYEPVYTSVFTELESDGLIKNGQINLGSAANRAVYDILYDEIFNYETVIAEEDYRIKNINATLEKDFFEGRSFMTVCARPVVYSMWNRLKARGWEIDFLPFPTKKIAAGCSGYGITRKWSGETQTVDGETRKNIDLCWDFIKFAITTEGQEVAGATGVSVPVLKSLIDTGSWRKALDENLNHDAFVAPEELRMSMFHSFECAQKIRANLRNDITSFLLELESSRGEKGEKRDALIAQYEAAFNQHLNAQL